MTELANFTAMLHRAGIEYTLSGVHPEITVDVEHGVSMATRWTFDGDGKLVRTEVETY